MTVTHEDRDAMADILRLMEGKAPSAKATAASSTSDVILAGPGQVTTADINAMANVLEKLNKVSNEVVNEMIVESEYNPALEMELNTVKTDNSIKIGRYQIMIKEDANRLAGKQYYSIYNTRTNDVIADDLSLYETALTVVKMLNSGKFANNPEIRKLFDHDEAYTSHKQDAIRYKRSMVIAERKGDFTKQAIYESRKQASIDRAMAAKKLIKTFRNSI